MNEKCKEMPLSTNNIWNKRDFALAGFKGWVKHFFRCIKWSRQRITRGYADSDVWDMDAFLQKLIPDMLENFKDNHHGAPTCLGEDEDTANAEWDRILDKMIFLWRESGKDLSPKKYRDECKDEAFEMLKEYFFCLWD